MTNSTYARRILGRNLTEHGFADEEIKRRQWVQVCSSVFFVTFGAYGTRFAKFFRFPRFSKHGAAASAARPIEYSLRCGAWDDAEALQHIAYESNRCGVC